MTSDITIFRNTCKGVEDCGICIFVCPKDVFEASPSEEMNELGFVPPRAARADRCNACMSCMISCPDMAIVVEKQKDQEKDQVKR